MEIVHVDVVSLPCSIAAGLSALSISRLPASKMSWRTKYSLLTYRRLTRFSSVWNRPHLILSLTASTPQMPSSRISGESPTFQSVNRMDSFATVNPRPLLS